MKPSELLAKPENWTKGASQRRNGEVISYHEATPEDAFCLGGALRYCNCTREETHRVVVEIQDRIFLAWMPSWNDAPERTHAQVLALLKSCGL